MKKVKRWRYYCDHCGKSGGSKWHTEKHEKVCTKNPDRVCGFCDHVGNLTNTRKLVKMAKKGADELHELNINWKNINSNHFERKHLEILSQISDSADCCPACILAALRQCGDNSNYINFDYKKAKEEFWENHPRESAYYGPF